MLSLTAAYGAFASAGIVRQPVLIRKVEDGEGKNIYTDQQKAQRAVSPATAFMMASMLADVINQGTAYRARQAGFTIPAAGKTGTTNDYVDAWFVGFTPHVVTGVWIGFDQPQTIIANGYGGELAVPIWAGFMKTATKGQGSDWFTPPPEVTAVNVCRLSGKLPNDGCSSVQVATSEGLVETRSMVYTEYFLKGTQPRTVCPLHPSPSFLDKLAGVFGAGDDQKPVPADQAGLPPPPAMSTSGATAPSANSPARAEDPRARAEETPDKEKKRGFWSKVFGRGKDDDKNKKKDEQKPPEKKKPGGG